MLIETPPMSYWTLPKYRNHTRANWDSTQITVQAEWTVFRGEAQKSYNHVQIEYYALFDF